VCTEPRKADQAHRDRKEAAGRGPNDPRDTERKMISAEIDLKSAIGGIWRQRKHGGRVCAYCLKDDEAEVDDARDAELHVERQAGDDVDVCVYEQVGRVIGIHPAAASAPRLARRPWGRRTITRTRMPKATASWYSGDRPARV